MNVIVVESSRVGAELALNLSKLGHSVCVVDPDSKNFDRLGSDFRGRMVEGVGFDKDTLIRAGIENADALAACTPSDNTNMVVARVARDFFNVPTVIARLYDPRRQSLYEESNIQTVCTSIWGSEQMVGMICHSDWNVVTTLGNGEVQVVALPVDETLAGRSVKSVTASRALAVVGLTHGGHTHIPAADHKLQLGDLLYVATQASAEDEVWAQLQSYIEEEEE